MDLLDIDEVQASAVASVQLARLAGRERQQLADDYDQVMAHVAELQSTLASPERQRELIGTEHGDYLAEQHNQRDAEGTGDDDRS